MFKHSGIIRRIDETGRLSIPKDVRRRFRIKEGDPVEIGENENYIAIKKYNIIDLSSEIPMKIMQCFSKITKLPVVLCNTSQILRTTMNRYSVQNRTEKFEKQYISEELYKALIDFDGICNGMKIADTSECCVAYCEKIVFNETIEGALIIPSGERELTSDDKLCLKLCSDIITAMYE